VDTRNLTLPKLWAGNPTQPTRDRRCRTFALARLKRKHTDGSTVHPGFGLWAVIALRFE